MEIMSFEKIKEVLKPIKIQSDKIINYAMIGYFLLGIILAIVYDTYWIAVSVGGLCLMGYYFAKLSLPQSNLYQYVASAVFAFFTAQFIYQMHGMFEMHFFVFVGSTILITYQNWKLQLPLIILVVLHHGSFAYLQYSGMKEIYFSQLDYMDLQTFIIHGALAALIIAICGLWSYQLNIRSITDAKNFLLLQDQITRINENILFAEEMSNGNLETFHEIEENDHLGKALNNMQANLILASKREKSEKIMTVGLTRISDVLRKNMNNLPDLCNETLAELVKYLNINQGALYIAEDKNGETLLVMNACYAYDRKKYLNMSIVPGEGLVGQCFLEREIIYLTDIPSDYIRITSGLGNANPTSLVVIPLISNDEIVGVIELASFQLISEDVINFLNKAAESIASIIISVKVAEKTTNLLAESRIKEEEMKAQEEEMRQNMEELETIQEELSRKNREFEKQVKN